MWRLNSARSCEIIQYSRRYEMPKPVRAARANSRLELLIFSDFVLLRSTEPALSGHSGRNAECRQNETHQHDVSADNGKSNEKFGTHVLILQCDSQPPA